MGVRNAVLFVDYENAWRCAAEEFFGGVDVTSNSGHFDPRKLGELICRKHNAATEPSDEDTLRLIGVRVYRGMPDERKNRRGYLSHVARKEVWRTSERDAPTTLDGISVEVVDPPLQYPKDCYPSEDERRTSVEKGVDTAMAIDVVSWVSARKCDVAIVFSQDRDHVPAVVDVLSRFVPSGVSRLPLIRAGWKKRVVWVPRDRLPTHIDAKLLKRHEYRLQFDDYEEVADHTLVDWNEVERRRETGEVFEAPVVGHNNDGLIVDVEGVEGFVPATQVGIVSRREEPITPQLQGLVGRVLSLQVLDVNRAQRRLILAPSDATGQPSIDASAGSTLPGRVSVSRTFGVLVDLGGIAGQVPAKEISWRGLSDPTAMFVRRQRVDVYVKGKIVDARSGRAKIMLSLWRASEEQWGEFVSHVQGRIVPATVLDVTHYAVYVRLGLTNVEGIVKREEMAVGEFKGPSDLVTKGDVVPVFVKLPEDNRLRHMLLASVKEARPQAREEGWLFDDGGRVVALPLNVRDELPSVE